MLLLHLGLEMHVCYNAPIQQKAEDPRNEAVQLGRPLQVFIKQTLKQNHRVQDTDTFF